MKTLEMVPFSGTDLSPQSSVFPEEQMVSGLLCGELASRPYPIGNFLNGGQSMQDLQLHPRIIERLRLIQSMLTGDEMQDDSGIENQDTSCEWSPYLVNHQTTSPTGTLYQVNTIYSSRNKPNLLRRAYPDLETYRDVQFRLLMAIQATHGESAQLLLDYGANPNVREEIHGQTPLYIAAQSGQFAIAMSMMNFSTAVNFEDG
ncbi:hypothetical protein OUZ56_012691 [Daphnia magna]|uniref:Uncharacterized protein n=2 Tax=Daphnia magna TaxID=35525 RepID=A0ABQ9Z3S3_9CRUS|nr:hypothetical protein OUZ56_012691 [Daphnia magna]